MELSQDGIRTLKTIGRLLQSKNQLPDQIVKIQVQPGECYPEAVLRTLYGLPADRQRVLDDAAIFANETEDAESSFFA